MFAYVSEESNQNSIGIILLHVSRTRKHPKKLKYPVSNSIPGAAC